MAVVLALAALLGREVGVAREVFDAFFNVVLCFNVFRPQSHAVAVVDVHYEVPVWVALRRAFGCDVLRVPRHLVQTRAVIIPYFEARVVNEDWDGVGQRFKDYHALAGLRVVSKYLRAGPIKVNAEVGVQRLEAFGVFRGIGFRDYEVAFAGLLVVRD